MDKFNSNFQTKILTALLTDKVFTNTVYDILDPNFFDHDDSIFLATNIKEYFVQYKTIPTLSVLRSWLDTKVTKEDFRKLLTTRIRDIYSNTNSEDLEYIKDQTKEFCRNQTIRWAIGESIDLLDEGKFDAILERISTAVHAGFDKDYGFVYNDQEVETRYETDSREPIPTGFDKIDALTKGGLGKGELGVVVAKTGGGKSWMLINIAKAALMAGKNVIYYTLELSEEYVAKRFDSNIIEKEIVKGDDKSISEVKLNLAKYKGKLIIKQYPSDSASIHTVESHVEMIKNFVFVPDMIVVDYADEMKKISHERRDTSDHQMLGDIYRGLRRVAGEKQLIVWTASQANRGDKNAKITEGEDIAGSYQKLQIADLSFSITRKIMDKLKKRAKIHIIKNRFGDDGVTFSAISDLSIGKFEIYDMYDPDSEDDEETDRNGMNSHGRQSHLEDLLDKQNRRR